METHWMKDYKTKEWTCCGEIIAQLMMSKLYPERISWVPTCPKCGEVGSPYPAKGGTYNSDLPSKLTKTKVVHCKKEKFDVMIDRSTPFGNRYRIGVDGNREVVIQKHSQFFYRTDWLMEKVQKELKGKVLG